MAIRDRALIVIGSKNLAFHAEDHRSGLCRLSEKYNANWIKMETGVCTCNVEMNLTLAGIFLVGSLFCRWNTLSLSSPTGVVLW